MTTDEIDNLEAGVEIDRMVAEACEVRLDHSGLVIPQLTDCKEVQFSPHRRSFNLPLLERRDGGAENV